jgi:predicted transcriptional regulator
VADPVESPLSRRERQIMDIVYACGRVRVAQVHQAIADPPSYSAVRAIMRILEEKGHLKHEAIGNRYVYLPTRSRRQASRSAIRRLVATFFGGSTEHAVAALLQSSDSKLTNPELDRLGELIRKARREGR